jgi:cellulase
MSGPVRDLEKFEMGCNVLGEIPNNVTIEVSPGDVVT